MTVGTDITTAWSAWLSALTARKVAADAMTRPGASEAQIVELEAFVGARLPPEVRALYRLCDGQDSVFRVADMPDGLVAAPLFGGYEFNSLEQAAFHWAAWRDIRDQSTVEELAVSFDSNVAVRPGHGVRKLYTHAAWIPFATDGGGNSLAIDLDPAPGGVRGQIVVIGPDEDERRVLAPGLAAFLTGLASMLEVGLLTIPRAVEPEADEEGDDDESDAPERRHHVVFFEIEAGMLQ
jgi:cell wall assembly regulator SMI1